MPATRRPRKLPYDGVRNGWYATLPDPAPARVLSGDVSADWAVLGGGELRALKAAPRAAFVPPDPILKFYAERRINAIERDEAGER